MSKPQRLATYADGGMLVVGPDRSSVKFSPGKHETVTYSSPGTDKVRFAVPDIAAIELGGDGQGVSAPYVPFTVTLHDGRTWTVGAKGMYLIKARTIANRFTKRTA